MKKRTRFITQASMIAALYVILTLLSNLVGLASGVIQIRLSEALCILPFFTPAAIPGLFIGCIISNIITGCMIPDIIFGSLATLIGAVFTYLLRKKLKWLAPIPPIIANTLIIPFILKYVYLFDDQIWFFFLTVGAGEIISCGIIGTIFLYALDKRKGQIFK